MNKRFSLLTLLLMGSVGVTAAAFTLVSPVAAQFDQSSGRDSVGTGIFQRTSSPPPSGPYNRAPQMTKKTRERQGIRSEDLLKYRDLLDQPQTGIIRLLTPVKCDEPASAEDKQKCTEEAESVRNFAGAYSFREKRYVSTGFADLELANDQFMSRGSNSQAIMCDLGDVPLTAVSLGHEGVKYLVDFQPAVDSDQATRRFAEVRKGIAANNFRYWWTVWVRPEKTYVMRNIAYASSGQIFKVNGKQDDIIVAFRVIRRDDDGSVTIIWKELQRKKAPTLKP